MTLSSMNMTPLPTCAWWEALMAAEALASITVSVQPTAERCSLMKSGFIRATVTPASARSCGSMDGGTSNSA